MASIPCGMIGCPSGSGHGSPKSPLTDGDQPHSDAVRRRQYGFYAVDRMPGTGERITEVSR